MHSNSLVNLDKGESFRFKNGNVPHNKGIPWSPELRQKIAETDPNRVEIACIQCKFVFSVAPSTAKTKKYCSQACYTEAQKTKIQRECEICEIEFYVWPSTLGKGTRRGREWGRFCSAKCQYKAQSGAGHPMWVETRIIKNCLECLEELALPPSQRDRKFCSKGCFDKFQTGDGPKDFYVTAAWKALSAACLRRDDYTCQYCNERGGRLNAHHCIPIRYGGMALDLDNLVTACSPCHKTEHWRIERPMAS